MNSASGGQTPPSFEGSANHGGAVMGNTMEPTEGVGSDYAYAVGQGAAGEY